MIVFDLDGTLSIVGDRLKYLEGPKKDWDAFYEACGEDKVNEPIAKIYKSILDSYWATNFEGTVKDLPIIVTGRRESTRDATLLWLNMNNLNISSERLFMRKDGDLRQDTIVKPELVANFFNDIEMIFEDRNSMVKKWRELGLTCLQVAEGNF